MDLTDFRTSEFGHGDYNPNNTLCYENLLELLPGFVHSYSFPNTFLIKFKRILIFCAKGAL